MSSVLNAINALAANYSDTQIALTAESYSFLLWCTEQVRQRGQWYEYENPADVVTDAEWLEINEIIDNAQREIIVTMVGQIIWSAAFLPPFGTLLCDGTEYTEAEYPILYENIDLEFRTGLGTFRVPDLRGKFMLGEDTTHLVGDTGGSETVTLTEAEIPPHSHSDAGHIHSEVAAVSAIINGGLEAPAAAAVPLPTSTGVGYANIQNTGGGEAHNNMPPYLTLRAYIVAA